MRITLESDYALRIITSLAERDSIVDAGTLAQTTSVSQRFALKILHKLATAGLVISFKGVKGGYKLAVGADEITLKQVIELIDGPIMMVRCLENSGSCALNKDKTNRTYHHIFDTISLDLSRKLSGITISDVINKNYKI